MVPNSTLVHPITVLFGTSDSPYVISLDHPIEQHTYRTICNHISSVSGGTCTELIIMDQVHGTHGHHITATSIASYQPRTIIGDYSHTSIRSLALAIITADCVPLVLYDPICHSIAAIHAGWRGATQHIIEEAITHLHSTYGSEPHHLYAWIGPSARSCCYEIREPLVSLLHRTMPLHTSSILRQHHDRWYADFATYSAHTLRSCGILAPAIDISPLCTICSPQFFSHRRNPTNRMRQISCILLQ